MIGAVLEVAWRVREGRECRVCGEDRVSEMVRNRYKLDGLETLCRACNRARCVAYNAANRDAHLAYRLANRDKRRDYGRAYRAANRAKLRTDGRTRIARRSARTDAEVIADRNAAHPDGLKRCRGGHTAPIDEFHGNRTKLDGLNDYCRPCQLARDAERRNGARLQWWAANSIPLRCLYCHGHYEHAEHVVPLAGGGPDEIWALRPACAACNLPKSDRPPLEWMASRPLLPYSDELAAVSLALALYGELRPDFPTRIEIPEDDE